ncbi:MAG: hypothetical protein M1816_000245 [Peltula sp. TS41687]|nr:MAG: hypothetical protein M1816_000245 [Peltula sp. TS41687]
MPAPTTRTHAFIRWLQLKRYQYEVTFPLYMFTPAEKFIFREKTDSLLFLFLSMIVWAATTYLPQHVATMIGRAWFYYAGEERWGAGGGGGEGLKDRG